ncbi:MAG: hypothetical protein IPP08_06850 [Chlorobiota bacterium]|nr:hypothetical protein [Chlorobiota bacterium]QQS65506.1 MAG: hypothetical protein IPP08_06850 [Chlorobiota bacterium]
MLFKTIQIKFIFIFLVISIASCRRDRPNLNNSNVSGGVPTNGDWVVVHSPSDPETLNPVTQQDAQAQEICGLYIYETLTKTDPKSLETIPWIADTLPKMSDDKMSYEIKLKKNVKFSDGHPLTGKDFICFFKAVKNTQIPNAAPLRGYFDKIKSIELKDNDPYILKAIMVEPYYLAHEIIGQLWAIPSHIWDPNNLSDKISYDDLNNAKITPEIKGIADIFNNSESGSDPKFMVGSGTYKFMEFKRNEKIVLDRNENYWNSGNIYGKQYPNKIIYRTINDYNAAVSSLKGGEIDFIATMPKVLYVKEKPGFEKVNLKPAEYDYPTYTYIGYNEKNSIFKDKTVRLALSKLIDRDKIIKTIYFGMAQKVQSPTYFKRPEYNKFLKPIDFDVENAKKTLTDAGWKDSDGDGILDKVLEGKKTDFKFKYLISSSSPVATQICLVSIAELKKIGIVAETEELEWSIFLKKQRDGQYDAYLGAWAMDAVEGDMYQIWHSKSSVGGGSNKIFYNNPMVDSLIETIRGEFDFEKRKSLYQDVQKIIYEDQPYTFLISQVFTGSYSARFQNVEFFPNRPCFAANLWYVPTLAQKYKN